MLEHFEVLELEEKHSKYNHKKKKFLMPKMLELKFDKTIVTLLVFISIAVGAIIWILFPTNNNSNIVANKEDFIEIKETSNTLHKNNSVSIRDVQNAPIDRGGLNFNDIGVDVSVDAGGFTINNTYENSKQSVTQTENLGDRQLFSTIPKDEIIDFGNPPSPPKQINSSNSLRGNLQSSGNKNSIKIETSALKSGKESLENKFYSTGNIIYSLDLAQQAYDKKNYDEAIKWALISNDIDKNNVQSWILFAKANYKKGNQRDALIALENFNTRNPNPEVRSVINQIKAGAL
ncbi:MAG: hypothetical protein GXZ15_01795 [Campylobacter sp.]|nr:hypothetical protein [Campylobacter sp.]